MAFDVGGLASVTISATDQTKSAWESIRAEANKTAAEITSFQSKVLGPFSALQSVLVSLAGALGAIKFLDFINATAKSAAEIDRMSQVVGASAANMSALAAVARMSGTDLGALEGGMVKLAKGMADSGDRTTAFSQAFKYLGLTSRDANGDLKSTDQMLLELAGKMDQYRDGSGKTALAVAALGKNGAALIPVLHDLAAAGQYNAKATDEQIAQAREYEENLKRLSAASSSWMKQIAYEVIPVANAFVKAMLEMTAGSGGVKDEVAKLAKDGTIREWAKDVALGIAFVVDQFDLFKRLIETLGKALAGVAGGLVGFGQIAVGVAQGMAGQWVGATENIRAGWAQMKESAIGSIQDIEKVWAKSTFSDALKGQFAKGFGSTGEAKPAAQFSTGDVAGAGDSLLKQMDALKAYSALQRAVAEAGQAINKAMLDHELVDLKASLDMRSISERQWIEEDGKLRVEAAQANAQRLTEEREKEVGVIVKMYGLIDQIVGKSAADEANQRSQALAKIESEQAKLVKLLGDERIAQEAITAARQHTGDVTNAWNQRIQDQLLGINRSTEDYIRSLANQTAAEELQLSLVGATSLAQAQANAQMDFANRLAELSLKYERERADLLQKKSDQRLLDGLTDQYNRQREALEGQRDAHLSILPLLEEQRQRAQALTDAWRAIDSTAFEVFQSMFDRGTDTWKKLADSLKATMIKALYELTVQRWTLQIFADLTGASVGAGGVVSNAGQTVNTISSLFGNAGSAGSLLSGAQAAWGWATGASTAASTAGVAAGITGTSTFAGTSAAASLGAGAAADVGAAAAGNAAASAAAAAGAEAGTVAAGASVVPVVGWVVAIAALAYSILSASKEPSAVRGGLSFNGPFEDSVSPTKTAFGSFGFSDAATQQFSGTIGKAMTDAIGALMDTAAKQLKPETVDALTKTLHDTVLLSAEGTYTTEDFINKFGPQMAHQLLDPILTEVDPYAKELADKFNGTFQEWLAYVGDILTVTGVLKDQGDALQVTFGQAITLQDIEGLRREGEGFSAALQRVGSVFEATNQIAVLFGKSQEDIWHAVGLASDGAREALVNAAGGIDKFTSSLNSYYTNYFSADEQLAVKHDQLATAFKAMGVEMPTTLSGFRSLVEGLDLSTESGRKLWQSLMNVQGPFHDYIVAIDGTADAAGKAANTFTLLHNSLGGLPDAAQIGSTSLSTFNRAITNTSDVAAAAAAATAASISKINGLLAYWQPGGAGSNEPAGPFLVAQRNSAVSQFQAGHSWAAAMGIDDFVNALTHIDPNDFARYNAADQALITSILGSQQQIEDFLRQQAGASSTQDTGSVQSFSSAVDNASGAVDQLAQQLDRARQSMADWLHSLGIDSRVSPLLPMQQFQLAQNDFVESILHFNRADPNSYAAFQSTGSAFLNQALAVFPRAGQTYGDIFQFVQSAGQQLLAGQNVAVLLNQLIDEIRNASRQSSIDVRNQTTTLAESQDQSTTKLVAANGNDVKWLQ